MIQKSIPAGLVLVILSLAFGVIPVHANPPPDPPQPGQTITIQSIPFRVQEGSGTRRIPAPQAFLQTGLANATASEEIIITFDGEWPEEAKSAVNYAANIWSTLIDPAVPITILARFGACWVPFCGAYAKISIDNQPINDILYPRTLLNHLSGYDVTPEHTDFEIVYDDSNNAWYYGTDGNPANNQIDLVTVTLHEIAHGLGMIQTFMMDGYWAYWGSINGLPFKYDTMIVNGAGQTLIDTSIFPNYSPELRAQLKTDDLYLDGPQTRAWNQGQRAKVEPFLDPHCNSCGDVSHLNDEYYQNSENELMTVYYPGEAFHNPGPVVLGIMADLGWTLSPNFPVLYPLPSMIIEANTQRNSAIDLWSYVPAEQLPGTNFTFEISNTPAPEAGVSLRDNRYIDLAPQAGWTGSTQVAVKATNLASLFASQTFDVVVVAELTAIFLPAIIR